MSNRLEESLRSVNRAINYLSRFFLAERGLSMSRFRVLLHILAYSPLTLKGLSPVLLGYTYSAWGILVSASSVLIVNWLRPLTGVVRLLWLNLAGLVAKALPLPGHHYWSYTPMGYQGQESPTRSLETSGCAGFCRT